jgi:hypothetical protein
MNLEQSITTRTPGNSVRKDTPLLQQVKSALRGTAAVPSGLILGTTWIETHVLPKVITQNPLSAIKIVNLIDNEERKSGKYLPETATILLREIPAIRLFGAAVFVHEYGHHLHKRLLKGTSLEAAAMNEFRTEQARVSKETPGGIDVYENWAAMLKVGTDGPSLYALRDFDEWMAESFAMLFMGFSNLLYRIAPFTHKAVVAAVEGNV